jgi:ABC-type bacteriocin/lantibiotic exporter with double-glycine peptidase domain
MVNGRRMRPLLAAGIAGLLLVGCEKLPVKASPEQPAAASLGQGTHLEVPFFPDDTDQCGPATLASVLTYWGIPSTPQALKTELYLPRLGGTLPIDLLLAAEAHGLKAESYSGSLEFIRAHLQAGHPLVALLNLGSRVFPQGHYVVITGFDDARQGLYVHSGPGRDVFLPYGEFFRGWEKMGRWTLLALPDSAQERVYL